MRHILILGGTTEASTLARALADRGEKATLCYAGRVEVPKVQPVAVRVGGFGGVDGLVLYIRMNAISHVVDATHPFAAQISANAIAATQTTGVPLIAFTRTPWMPGPGDQWICVPDIAAAVAALAGPPQSVLLALGRMHLASFAAQPQHHYVLRLIDPPIGPPPLPRHSVIVARGPFDVAGDVTLMRCHAVDRIVAKNAGGRGADAKLDAARLLGLPVLMIDRPAIPARHEATKLVDVLDWLDHADTERGV